MHKVLEALNKDLAMLHYHVFGDGAQGAGRMRGQSTAIISESVPLTVRFIHFAALSRLSAALPTLLPPRTNLSVVGSGPTLCPGKSLLSNERMKLVFPTLYCPTISTIGLASKSAGFMGGE